MRLNSIRTRTLLALLLICMVIVSILGGIWLYTTGQHIKDAVSASDLHASELMANYVQMYVEGVESSQALASGNPEVVSALRETNATRVKSAFEGLVLATPQDDIAFVVDRNGKLLYSTCSTADHSSGPDPVFIDASRNTTYVTGTFYSDEFKEYVFAIVTPIRDNGTIIGYAYDEIRPQDLFTFMMKEKKHMVHHVILTDGTGRAILFDNRSLTDRHVDLSAYAPVKKALDGEAGIIEHAGLDDGQPYISAYYPIPNTSWAMVVSTQADVAYRPLRSHMLWIAGIFGLLIVVLTAFGYFASRYLIDPVDRISRTMQKVAAGDYSVSVEATRDDEIGDLERAFNSLVAEIKKRDAIITTEKDRSQFYLDLMSHDINNMNHAGMGYLELALGRLKSRIDAENLALIEKAYDNVRASSMLIDNVRKIQKVQTGQTTPEIINICPMLEEVAKKYAEVPGRSVTINYTPSGSGCYVRSCDLLKEAFANIVGNAIKHSDPARPLIVNIALARVSEGGRAQCRVSIEDNGPGISDELKKTIFTRFQRGRTDTGGRGLGLFIVRTLVEEFGGRVWAEDRVPGDYAQGVRFVITMPSIKI